MEKYYFQARFKWAIAFGYLTDSELGNLMRAVWKYAETGERILQPEEERLSMAFAVIAADMDEDNRMNEKKSKARSEAALKRWNAKNAIALPGMQEDANDAIKNKNNNQNNNHNEKNNDNKNNDENLLSSPVEEAVPKHDEQNPIYDLWNKAGFPSNQMIREKLMELSAEHGQEKMLSAISKCALASPRQPIHYLIGILQAESKKTQSKTVYSNPNPATHFQQRNWNDDDGLDEMEALMKADIQEVLHGSSFLSGSGNQVPVDRHDLYC